MSYSGLRVLVTGADGFIGSHLVESLIDEGARVTALSAYINLPIIVAIAAAMWYRSSHEHRWPNTGSHDPHGTAQARCSCSAGGREPGKRSRRIRREPAHRVSMAGEIS